MISFTQTEFNLGTLQYGLVHEIKVAINNTGEIPIQISVTNTSCSCTNGAVDKNPVPAHEQATLTIYFDTNKAGTGNQSKSLTASWQDNNIHNQQTFRFQANVSH